MTTIAQTPDHIQLDALCSHFKSWHTAAVNTATALENELNTVRKQHVKRLGSRLSKMADAQAELTHFIEAHPKLFNKPKTMTLHGVKVGFKKGKGKVIIPQGDKAIELIKKHLPAFAKILIRTTTVIDKNAAKKLTGEQLAKIGGGIIGGSDETVIKVMETDAEQLLARVAKDTLEQEIA